MIGTKVGPFEVLGKLGEGGMGEVYRARDTKLNRDVAIKVLPDLFALDPDRLARFTREAQVLASLNHPNIAAIYGIEGNALVMELVEGEDLSALIARGSTSAASQLRRTGLPIDEVLPIAKQIADALEAAHEQGIVHRDLKPANIKVRPDGTVKVLDFGLAKAMSPDGSATADAMQSPTLTAKATALGVIIGTAAYMSPEQARGRAIDRRTDVWAFGCVLYEMLTGRRAFDGDDATEIIAAVVKTEPDLTVLAGMPPHLRSVVARCLVKERKARVPDLSVVRYMLDESAVPVASLSAPAPAPVRASVLPWAIASIGLVAAGVMLWQWAPWRAAPAPAPIRFEIAAAATGFDPVPAIYRNIALSPDGTKIVYGTGTGLMIRSLDQMEPTVLRANARQGGSFLPFFSPDGRWVGFFDLDGMKKVLVTGGPAVQITNTIGPRGASWGPGDTIYFANSDLNSGILSVSANGGEVKTLTQAENGSLALDHIYPSVLPGGRGIVYTVLTASLLVDNMQIAVLDLATGKSKVLINGGTQAEYVAGPGGAGGYLVYAAAGTLRAVPFNLKTLEVVGDGVPVVDGVAMTTTGPAHFGVSTGGTLVYASGALTSTAASRSLVWIDRNGHEEPIARAPRRSYFALRLSPDGTRLALDIRDENSDIWVWHLTNETLTRLTFPVGTEGLPIWSPDSSRIVYYSAADANNLFWQPADGTGSPERLTKVPHAQAPLDFSRDGKQMLIRERPGATGDDVSVMSMATRAVTPLFHTAVNENNAQISPDGRWIAYESAETTPTQVYVRPFPDVNSGRWQVSSSGGLRPMWGPDGKELFFAGNDGLMVVPVDTAGHFSFGPARRLFDVRITAGLVSGRSWDISPDGRRFIVIKDVPPDPSIPVKPQAIAVVINWVSDLQTRLKR